MTTAQGREASGAAVREQGAAPREWLRAAEASGRGQDACGPLAAVSCGQLAATATHEQKTALWVAAFFDELAFWGVRDVVVSPGSRSTALAMAAFEMNRRCPDDLRLYVDVDERGASFFALGLAKASGRPAVLVCTSGTALANYYPAVIEAETSRVPLIVLSGDRPPQLQGLGAPQTTDQLKAYGDHVRAFRAMPLPACGLADVAFVRQAAREACIAAMGVRGRVPCAARAERPASPARFAAEVGADGARAAAPASAGEAAVASRGCMYAAGAVHLNFPFDEPLKPDFPGADKLAGGNAFAVGRGAFRLQEPLAGVHASVDMRSLEAIESLLRARRVAVLAGEGTCSTLAEVREVVAWARKLQAPLFADPLSGLRSVDDELVVDNFDNVFRQDDCPLPDVVVRFGRYPVSKHAVRRLARAHGAGELVSIVVDAAETRDFNFATDVFVPAMPLDFVRSRWMWQAGPAQRAFAEEWAARNCREADRIAAVGGENANEGRKSDACCDLPSRAADCSGAAFGRDCLEGAYVSKMLELAPANSCVFSANSMAIRAIDTFYRKSDKPLALLCNRGQNGIDGTTSTALGAAQSFAQTTFLVGDFTFLHDLSALALQRELLVHHGGDKAASVVVVLLNNNGGAIFDMLPQASDDDYFERLFLVPQDVRFEHAAAAFGVPYRRVDTVSAFACAYEAQLGVPGISVIEVQTPLRGVRERYGRFQQQ